LDDRAGASHVFEDHVGELEIRLRAPSLAELFEEAAHALVEVMGDPGERPIVSVDLVRVEAHDREALLVGWLNDLIFRYERDRRLPADVKIEELDDGHLVARVRFADAPGPRTLVKAATFHGLRIEESPDGASANVILDV
jgi:SHS2 domain-containing protein